MLTANDSGPSLPEKPSRGVWGVGCSHLHWVRFLGLIFKWQVFGPKFKMRSLSASFRLYLVSSNARKTTWDDAGRGFARAGVDRLAKPRPPTPAPTPTPPPASPPSFWRLVRPPAPSPGFLMWEKICIAENLNVALVSFHLLRSQTSMAAPFACRCFQNCSVLAILRLFGKFKWPCLWKVLGQLPSCICIQMRCQDHKTWYPC